MVLAWSICSPNEVQRQPAPKLGSEWSNFLVGRDVYISHKEKVGASLAETDRQQVTNDEAMKIVEADLIFQKYVLLQHMHYDGSFSSHWQSHVCPVCRGAY